MKEFNLNNKVVEDLEIYMPCVISGLDGYSMVLDELVDDPEGGIDFVVYKDYEEHDSGILADEDGTYADLFDEADLTEYFNENTKVLSENEAEIFFNKLG